MVSFFTGTAQEKITITGKVTDAETGDQLMYAGIFFPETGTGTTTN